MQVGFTCSFQYFWGSLIAEGGRRLLLLPWHCEVGHPHLVVLCPHSRGAAWAEGFPKEKASPFFLLTDYHFYSENECLLY